MMLKHRLERRWTRGIGNWDLSTSNWWDGTNPLILWPNLTTDRAIFHGPTSALPTANTVTVSSGINANALAFWRSGYTLTGGDVTLSGASQVSRLGLLRVRRSTARFSVPVV